MILVTRLAGLAIAGACGACASPNALRPTSTPTGVILALGDSLTAGHGLRADEAWPALIAERVAAENLPYRVLNAGVSGDTTARGRGRLAPLLTPEIRVVVVALGANDGIRGVPVEEVRRNLAAIITASQQRNARVLLCAFEALPVRGWDYSLAFHRLYYELAAEFGVPLVPFFLAEIIGRQDLLLPDLVHPNAAGARTIAEAVWPHLQALLAAEAVGSR